MKISETIFNKNAIYANLYMQICNAIYTNLFYLFMSDEPKSKHALIKKRSEIKLKNKNKFVNCK